MKFIKRITLTSILLLVLSGCSSAAQNSLSDIENTSIDSGFVNTLPIIGFDDDAALGLLGRYSLSISPDGSEADLSTFRYSSIGESFTVSGGAFFTITPCADCLAIGGIGFNANNEIELVFKIKHPFQKGVLHEPPSAKNRLDLDIFDVALVFVPGNKISQQFARTGLEVYSGIVLNQDGYTTELETVINDDTGMPYIICYEKFNNNRFEMGTPYQDFDVILTPEQHHYQLYLTMGYGSSATMDDRLVPTYYIPEFNRKSAWKIVVTPPEGLNPPAIGNTWDNSDTIKEYDVTIDIYDWNHGATVSTVYPDSDNTNHIRSTSDIVSVTVEIPGMMDALIEATTTDSSSNGWDDPQTYNASIANENRLSAGEYTGLVKVLDSRVPGTVFIGGESDTLVHSQSGTSIEFHELTEFATYQTFTATVVSNGGWAKTWGGVLDDNSMCVALDDERNIFVTGIFMGAVDLDPGPGQDIHTSVGEDVFLSKFDSLGTYQWGHHWGGNGGDISSGVAVDSLGNVYVNGNFRYTVDFDPGPSVDQKTSNGTQSDIFMSKFDNAGNFLWVRVWGGPEYDATDGPLLVDESDNIYLTGRFRATMDFDPGMGIVEVSSYGGWDAFLLQLDSDGVLGWNVNWGGLGTWDGGITLTDDSVGNLYVIGFFDGTVDFDPGPGIDEHSSGISYVSKFDKSGFFKWARTWSSSTIYGVACDGSDALYVGGGFYLTIDFDPGPGVEEHTPSGDWDSFFTRLDQNGNFQWVRIWGGDESWVAVSEIVLSCDVSSTGNVILTGSFMELADFDPGPGEDMRFSVGTRGIYVTTFDSTGEYLWAFTASSPLECEGKSLALDISDNIYVVGFYSESVDFQPCYGSDYHVAGPSLDAYLMKLLPNGCWE